MGEEFFIQLALGALLSTVKNPKRSANLNAGLIKLRDALNAQFPPTLSAKKTGCRVRLKK